MNDNLMRVGVIGPAKGLKGGAIVDVRTDSASARFAPGTVLQRDGNDYTVRSFYRSGKRWVVTFEEITTREEIEAMRGKVVSFDVSEEELDEGEFYASELEGLPIYDPQGNKLGSISGLEFGIGQDRLKVTTETGTFLVPFVKAIVQVDLQAERVVVDAPAGLLGD